MSRRAATAIAGLVLAGGAVACAIVAMASRSSVATPGIASADVRTVGAEAVATTTWRSAATTTTVRRPEPATTTSAPTTTSTTIEATSTVTTITPVATYVADIGILAPTDVAAPVRVIIPALEIDGPVLAASVDSKSQLDVPPDARSLVWYRHGPSPGEPGSAVIAGHLNWRGVTGLFSRLAETPVGASITVVYDDGSEQAFTVFAVELVPKPAVSVNGVFARDGDRLLRLITCGGEFEEEVRSYRSNVIVTAVPV